MFLPFFNKWEKRLDFSLETGGLCVSGKPLGRVTIRQEVNFIIRTYEDIKNGLVVGQYACCVDISLFMHWQVQLIHFSVRLDLRPIKKMKPLP